MGRAELKRSPRFVEIKTKKRRMLLLADFPLHGWEFRKDAPSLRISGNIKTHGANATEKGCKRYEI